MQSGYRDPLILAIVTLRRPSTIRGRGEIASTHAKDRTSTAHAQDKEATIRRLSAPLTRAMLLWVAFLLFPFAASAQTLPTAQQVASQINLGWNLGNTLEAICSETAWGNPVTNQALINAVKAAGFNAIRIPVSWDCHTAPTG